MTGFQQVFGEPPRAEAAAPGRVNLLGEHTDYNEGYVMPSAIPQRTHVQLGPSPNGCDRFFSVNLQQMVEYRDGSPAPAGFARYVQGCIELARGSGAPAQAVQIWIDSEVPIGAGLSSSAALEVAVLRGLRALFDLPLDDVAIARLAQQAEVEYAKVRVGIMDQMASSLADVGHLLFLDTRSLERRLLPLPEGSEVAVIHSGEPRNLAASDYNLRRRECEEAARLLGVTALRDIGDAAALAGLPPPLDRRARHVVTENARVLSAARGVDAAGLGALMNASHASLRDDYAVSTPALDLLTALLAAHPDVYGAKLTGAGFGGACVALCQAGRGGTVKDSVLTAYRARGHEGVALV